MGSSPIVGRINALLAEKGISKQSFYKDCGITSASYSLWNTGKTTPRIKNLETIAKYLNTTVDYLLTGLGEKEAKAQPPAQQVSDDDIKFALFGDTPEVTDEMYASVKNFARWIAAQEQKKKESNE